MTVIGTAGHVDHGKTSLVYALTKVNTDRLPEEQRRGISIELGFAPFKIMLPNGEERVFSIVDVPGHERFVGTMVAGAQGVDLALLVVAADVGVMPQTREHSFVLQALGVERLIVVLTRCDLADQDTRMLAQIEIQTLLQNTPWPTAPILEVSSLTGEGLEALRMCIVQQEHLLEMRKKKEKPFRLPIDRVFSPRGQGVIVTGTLLEGSVQVGEVVEVAPLNRNVRVRGLHVHNESVSQAVATCRVAISLAGIERSELRRGHVLVAPGTLLSTRVFDAILTRVSSSQILGPRTHVFIHSGTTETVGRIIMLGPFDAETSLEQTHDEKYVSSHSTHRASHERLLEKHLVRVITKKSISIAPSDRLLVRVDAEASSMGKTIGSLFVLRVDPGRMSKGRSRYVEQLRSVWVHGNEHAQALGEIESTNLVGLTEPQLLRRIRSRRVSISLKKMLSSIVIGRKELRWVSSQAQVRTYELMHHCLTKFHLENPYKMGVSLATLLATVPSYAASGLAEHVLAQALKNSDFINESDCIRLASFQPTVHLEDPIVLALEQILIQEALTPRSLTDIAQELKITVPHAQMIAETLSKEKRIVRVQGDLWFAHSALHRLRTQLISFLQEHTTITTGQFKELVGASRKFVIPLAEWFDAQKVTLRVGDVRKLRLNTKSL